MRLLLLLLTMSASYAMADEPFRVSLNLTTGGRWLEGTKVYAGKNSVQLEGSEFVMGGTVDLMKRLGAFRLGGQVGTEVVLFPREVSVIRNGPLATSETSDDSVTSLVFVTASPFVGAGVGDGALQGWIDVLVTLEVASARIERERHFALTPVPTVRLGAAMLFGDGGAGFELALLASYFGSPRLAFSMGFRF
ncbi:MAG: hypothetical protein QM817_30440 [Archangium sp.]